MKIALVIYTYSETGGGAERACSYLTRGLLSQGHEVHLFAHQLQQVPSGAIAHEVPTNEIFLSWKYVTFAANSKKLLEQDRYDIIHSFTRTYYQDILRLGGGTHRQYLRNMDSERSAFARIFLPWNPNERAQLDLEARGFQKGAYRKIVAVSQRVKEEVIHHYGVPESDLVVLYNGVDLQAFSPALRTHRVPIRQKLGLSEKDLVFLFCGRGGKRKGLGYAMEALRQIPNAHLLIVGEGPYRTLARTFNISNRTHLLGRQDDVGPFYGSADAFLFPTLYDPFPNVCLEAMACGLPVITTRVTGIAEIVTQGRDAHLVEEGQDIQALASAMKELADPARRQTLSQAARKTAEQFSLERNLQANLALYQSVNLSCP